MSISKRMDRVANTTQEMVESQRRSYEALTDSFIEFQKRNVRFIQSGFGAFGLQEDNLRAAREWWNGADLAQLQQRNVNFLQSWVSGGADYLRNQAEHNQHVAEEFARSARAQQESLRKLGEDWMGVYEEMANTSRSYAEEGMHNAQQATRQGLQAVQETAEQTEQAARQATSNGNGSFPIRNYDDLSVNEASQRLNGLTNEQLQKVRAYEKQNKDRSSLVDEIDRKIKSA